MSKVNFQAGNMLYPVPAVMISCQRKGEKPNIITVAWAGTVCSDPPMLSISVRKERYSYAILDETHEFVVNLVTKKLVFAADYCGVKSGRQTDKFRDMKLTPLPSRIVSAPGIAESPVNIECQMVRKLELGSHDIFLAQVVNVAVEDSFLDANNRLRLDKAGLTAYSHGEYFALGEKIGRFGYSVRKRKL